MAELKINNFVVWKRNATLTNTASMPMTGGNKRFYNWADSRKVFGKY